VEIITSEWGAIEKKKCREIELTHFHKNHRRDFLRRERPDLTQVLNLNDRVSSLLNHLKWPRLDILLDNGVIITTADKAPEELSEPFGDAGILRKNYLISKIVFSGFIAA
jgi:hypothetical protein